MTRQLLITTIPQLTVSPRKYILHSSHGSHISPIHRTVMISHHFNIAPFKPRDIRNILSKANKRSAPGPCGITYNTLLKLESTHHILATYFNKVFMSGAHPPSWGESVVKLINKKGATSVPSNFRMIALSGYIGKTYHLLLTERLTTFLTSNKLIDPTLQKAFLPGINGCIEHNLVMDEIIKDAKNKKKTCHITFFFTLKTPL